MNLPLIQLLEAYKQHATITPVPSAGIIRWCESNCKSFLSKGISIYRGTEGTVNGITNTDTMNRMSANTMNYYTLCIDNLPEWSKFPKRSKSLISTCSFDMASSFSDEVYMIIPEDSANIGICPTIDMWMSTGSVSLEKINHAFYRVSLQKFNTDKLELDFKYLESCWKKIPRSELLESLDTHSPLVFDYVKSKTTKDNMFDIYGEIINPVKLGFNHVSAANFTTTFNEIWIQGKCAMISSANFDDELISFMQRYNIGQEMMD